MRRPSNLLPLAFHHKSGRLKVTLYLTGLESLSMPRARVRQMQGIFGETLKRSPFNWLVLDRACAKGVFFLEPPDARKARSSIGDLW